MTHNGLYPFPEVAVELVRCVLEVTAYEDRQTALSLACVSKVVQQWITPIIYHTLVPAHSDQINSLARSLPGTLAGKSVRRLVIVDTNANPAIPAVILACPHLETLITDADLSIIDGTAMCTWPAPVHVLLIARTRFQLPKTGHPLVRNATHLYIDYPNEDILDIILFLPRLTHLCLGVWEDDSAWDMYARFAARMLARESLKMLLVHGFDDRGPRDLSPGRGLWVKLAAMQDVRLIAGPGMLQGQLVASGATLWDHAAVRHKNWRQGI